MSFFNFTPGDGTREEKWTMSSDFWRYWAVAIPLTALTVATWAVFHQRRDIRPRLQSYWRSRLANRRLNVEKSTSTEV
jgi:hypothetical protein